MIKSAIIVTCIALCALGTGTAQIDSLFYVTGARGMVPCNDGSFIGGIVSCRDLAVNFGIGWCARPVLTRSWDGGVTWAPENTDIPDHSLSGIVRLYNGDLLTSHGRWADRFVRSTDNGHSWFAEFDTTLATATDLGGFTPLNLVRDSRGMLFWREGGALLMSIDEGKHAVYQGGTSTRDGYYVLFPHGMLVTHLVAAATNGDGSIDISYDHGRSWTSLRGGRKNDSMLYVKRSGVIRDTLVVGVSLFIDRNPDYNPSTQTWYHHEGSRSWMRGVDRGGRYPDFVNEILFDSTEAVWGHTSGSISRTRANEEETELMYLLYGSDSLPLGGDSNTVSDFYPTEGIYYDLDGNVHPHGMKYLFPPDKPRPVSLLDRLYTCNGLQYVVGGRAITDVRMDAARSKNASLTHTITPNKRLVTIDVVAIDTTKPMYVAMSVDDSILGKQWFYDSVGVGIAQPTVNIVEEWGWRHLSCDWPDGPFMWYKDGEPLKRTDYGYNGDAIIKRMQRTPGVYKVRGRTRYGCVVESNEVVIATTGVEETTTPTPTYKVWYDGNGVIHVEWDAQYQVPRSIVLTDAIGRTVSTQFSHGEGQARINVEQIIGVVFVTVENSGMRRTYGVVCMP